MGLLSLKLNAFTMVFALILIAGLVIPVISVSLNQLQASSEGSWERQGYSDCVKCHPVGMQAETSVVVKNTLDKAKCIPCHGADYNPLPGATANSAHAAHTGKMHTGYPAPDDLSKHPGIPGGWSCSDCHKAADCQSSCHSKSMPHIAGKTDCKSCHGTLPSIVYHSNVTIATGNHTVLGSGRYGCFACHNNQTNGITGYKLANATVISVNDPSKLCWQCHSDYYRDWIAGNHHDSAKQCTNESCHNPHEPYLPRAAAAPTQTILGSPSFLFGVAIVVVVIIGATIYLLKRKRK